MSNDGIPGSWTVPTHSSSALLQLKMHCLPYGIKGISIVGNAASERRVLWVWVRLRGGVGSLGDGVGRSMGLREVYHSVVAGSGRVEIRRQLDSRGRGNNVS